MKLTAAEVCCVVPARSGSQRIVDKNLQIVGGVTLLERAVATARAAFGCVLVSTDSPRYASIATDAGATVPGLRPAELATAESTTDDVVRHVLQHWAPEAKIVVVVQTTSPFTEAQDLLTCVARLDDPTIESSLTVVAAPPGAAYVLIGTSEHVAFGMPEMATLRTQDVPPLWMPTGGAFASRAEAVRCGKPLVRPRIAAAPVDSDRSLDIDTPDDLRAAQGRA